MDNHVDNFVQDLAEALLYSDLLLAAIVDNTVDISALTDAEILAAELTLMDTIAERVAGELVAENLTVH